jgi:hypothetical protein
MAEVIKGIPNERLLELTNRIAGLSTTFKGEDMMITPANEKQILSEAEASARAYAEARNRGASPRSRIGEDASLVAEVKAWIYRRRLRGHGKQNAK